MGTQKATRASKPRGRVGRMLDLPPAVLAGFLALVLLLGLITSLAYRASTEYAHSVDAVLRYTQTRMQLERVRRLLVDAETAERGFVITGQESYLGPYEEARQQLPEAIRALRAQLENGLRSEHLNRALDAAHAKLDELEVIVRLRREGHLADSLARLQTGIGFALMMGFTEEIQALIDLENSRIAASKERHQEMERITNRVVLVGSIVVGLGLLAAARQIAKELRRRQETQTALSDSEERYRALTSGTFDPVLLHEGERIIEANRALLDLLGITHAELLATSLDHFVAPESQELLSRMEFSDQGQPYEVTLVRKDGSKCQVEVRASSVRYGGRVVRALALRDITELRHLEESKLRDDLRREFLATASGMLASSLELGGTLQQITDLAVPQLADGCSVLLQNPDGEIEIAASSHLSPIKSRLLREIFERFPLPKDSPVGYPKVLRTGRSDLCASVTPELLEKLALGAEHRALFRQVELTSWLTVPLIAGGRVSGTLTLINTESDRRYDEDDVRLAEELAHRAAVAIENAQLYKTRTLLLERERNARSDAEALVERRTRELADTRSQLVQSEKLATAGQLAAGVAHEINNPLAFVLGNLEYLSETISEVAGDNPDLLQCLKEVRGGAERIRGIVRDLKAFSRADENGLKSTDVQKTLDFAIALAANEIRHRARLEKVYASLPPILAHEGKLGQVFLNILINAAQALPEGEAAKHQIRVVTHLSPEKNEIWVDIEDTGSGMPPDVIARIFDPFFTTKPVGVGTGLGLSICHGIIQSLGGNIEVSSAVGLGSRFRIRLPIREVPESADLPSRPAVTKASPAERLSILIIDDEDNVAQLFRRLLREQYDVQTTTSGREGLSQIISGKYDVVFCDLMMPDLSGVDICEALKASGSPLLDRLVFMSGGAFTQKTKTFLESGQYPFLEKPFTVEAVRRAIQDRHQKRRGGPELIRVA